MACFFPLILPERNTRMEKHTQQKGEKSFLAVLGLFSLVNFGLLALLLGLYQFVL